MLTSCLHAGPGAQQQTAPPASSASSIQQSSLMPAAALHQWRPQASRQAQMPGSTHTSSQSARQAVLEASLVAEVQQCLHELALGSDSSTRLLCALCRRLQFSCQGRLQQEVKGWPSAGREDVAVVRVVGALVAASSACQRLVLQSLGALEDSEEHVTAAAAERRLWLRC